MRKSIFISYLDHVRGDKVPCFFNLSYLKKYQQKGFLLENMLHKYWLFPHVNY